ncbi:unnamed protein product [Symbiodinium sp. CCMP2456]|nr:unnamed protein product [Symbiodinium sp. CCMP2456]
MLTRSMTQLQEMQAKTLQRMLDEEAPEAVKSSVPVLPPLPSPEGISTGIVLQDWLAQIAIAMQDLSPSSGAWWTEVMEAVQTTYTRWLGSTPLERLQLQPLQYKRLSEGKWTRVNARACAMLLQSLTEVIKQDLIARRVVQHTVLIMFRLHTMYQPGGASEKTLVLGNLQSPVSCDSLDDALAWLRAWPRWIQRCQDLSMMCPDGTVLAKTLTAVTSKFIAEGGDAQFRTQLLRSTLRIDGQPSLDDVKRYHQHLQAELESAAVSRTLPPALLPRVKAIGVGAQQERSTSSVSSPTSQSKTPCKYFFKASGCRRGQKCPYGHDMSNLTKQDRSKKCLSCGAEDHRQRDCPTKVSRPGQRSTGSSDHGGGAASTVSSPTAPRVQRAEPEGEASPSASGGVVAAEPVWTLETLLQAAAKVAGAKAAPTSPSLNVISLRAHRPLSGGLQTYALVDSGATHALRRAASEDEWSASHPVVVNLAGGESISLRMNDAGTILVPSTASDAGGGAPIVPLGALVGQLGYTMTWSGTKCRLEGRQGECFNLRVRDGCPEIAEHDALQLIAKLEDSNLEELKSNIKRTRQKVRTAAMMMERNWFDYLQNYAQGGIATEALKAIEAAPFFRDLPQPCLEGFVDAVPEQNGWEVLKGLQHLNRRTRKRLWSSDKWVVHLFAGEREKRELLHLEAHGYTILELDIERGKTQEDVREVNKQTQLIARMIYLHALATAGRITHPKDPTYQREVGFLLEHPRDPRGYLKYGDPLYPGVVSLWRMSLWTEYALEAGMHTYSFDMAALGKVYTRHTTCGTNLPLRHLDRLRSRLYSDGPVPERAPACVWPAEFLEHVTIALRNWGTVPRMVRMSAEQWKDHVRRGHLPYRADCAVCVQAGGTGRRHARLEHPAAFVLSSDLSGPVKVGGSDPDARGAFPKQFKYIFVAKLRVPKSFVEDGRGTWVEYDDGELGEEDYKDEDDGLASEHGEQVEREGIEPKEVVPDRGEAEAEEDDDVRKKLDPEEDIDLAPPELVNLIFATGIRDEKAATVLEATQDVVLYCQALNIPVLRFHSDRGMEFQARATKQWLKSQGIRVMTSEAGVHQTNGAAESTVRWIKQRVMVRKRQLEGPKLDDLTPKWVHGYYVGRSESLSKGHLVFVQEEDSGRFIHTLHVRAGLHDPGPVEADVDADEPAGPSRRVRGKSAGSGDVVALSKAVILDDADYKRRAEQLMTTWSQEEAKVLIKEVCQQLPASENVYGMFRYGGKAGVTRATLERPWFTAVLLKMLKDKVPDAEFASIYVSVNNQREVHIDRNNAMGTINYILPLTMPRRGGEIWQELRDGDVVSGRVTELTSQDGKTRYGCAYPLQAGEIFCLNPHRRHAVLPSSGDRLVLVGYTPGMLQNLQRTDRALLWKLGFPMPLRDDEEGGDVRVSMLSVRDLHGRTEDKGIIVEDVGYPRDPGRSKAASTTSSTASESNPGIPSEDWLSWELYLSLDGVDSGAALVGTDSWDEVVLRKAEVGFTENVEDILNALNSPLNIVHTVNPKEVVQYFDEWIPSLNKEIASLEHAVEKVHSSDQQVCKDLEAGQGQVIPMKVVFTVKPPDMPADGSVPERWYKRKSRIVICGNLASHQPGEVYTNTAPAEVVRAAIAIARMFNWDLGIIDVVAAFLQTPLEGLKGAPLVYGIPPKLLVKAGLCKPGELWKLTHAVYGLQESPKLWGMYRDIRLAQIQLVFEGKKVVLMQGRVEPSWWSILQEGSQLIGILVVYVDDILLCGRPELIKEIASAIREVWKTSDLQLVSEGAIRFLGIEISMCTQGFALTQKSYIEELVRLHQVPPTRRDLIPISKDLANFSVEEHEGVYTEQELRKAQQCAGELLWISQRTRPDLSYVASLVGSLSTRAPRRATQIAEKAIAFLQRTMSYALVYSGDNSGLVGYCDASFAPDGSRSHSAWLVLLNDCVISWRSGRQSTITLSTAESELTAMSEVVLALQSVDSMLRDVLPGGQKLQLYSDSTSALAIANGSGSWRTRHLRLRSAWVSELIANQAITVHHCIGEVQPADLLTKALASQRMRSLSKLINLYDPEDDEGGGDVSGSSSINISSINAGSSAACAPKEIPKGLIALLVLSQAVTGSAYNWEEEEAVVVKTALAVDYGMLTWAFLWATVVVFLITWELLKWLMWLAYDKVVPGASSRRMRRLQKLRSATTEAIQREIQARSGTRSEQRAHDANVLPPAQKLDPPRAKPDALPKPEVDANAEERIQLLRRLTQGTKETRECGVQSGVFTPCGPAPETRVILRYVHEPPGETFFVPGNECYHVYGDCHAFRHRGTADRVEKRRICQYCVNRAQDDPDKSADYGRDLERAREYERVFNSQLRVSGQSVASASSDAA